MRTPKVRNKIRHGLVCLSGFIALFVMTGCTQVVEMSPKSGPPGTVVYVKCSGMFGDPSKQSVKWDGKTIKDPFPGSFTVPAVDQGGSPGKHKVTIVDKLDDNEAFLIFPIFRGREASATFVVQE